MDSIGEFASEIKERYEIFFDMFSKNYPNGVGTSEEEMTLGEMRNLFIADVLAPVSMIYVMSDIEERKEMTIAAKYIFGLEDIEKILVCMIDEAMTMGICFCSRFVYSVYEITKLPSMTFDFIKSAVLAICFPHGRANIDQRMFLVGSYIQFNERILRNNGKLEKSLVPISGFPTYQEILKKYNFTVKPYTPLEESNKANGFYSRMSIEIRQKRVQKQVENGRECISYITSQTLNNVIFDALFFEQIKDIAPKMLGTPRKDKRLYSKILKADKTVIRSLFTEFNANILEKKTIIEFCVEYLDKPDCDALSYVIAEAVCEVHDYTSSWEESCFKMVKMLLYDFRPYNKSPFQDPTDPSNLKYADKVRKLIHMFNIIIPALDVDERKEALGLLDDKLYGDKYSFFVPRRYEKLIEERRKEEKKMTIEEVKQYLDNFYEAVSNVKIIEELIPGSSTVVKQNSINEILNYMIYLITADGNVSEEDAHICSVISGIKCTPFGIQYSILSSGINFWEFQKQIPHFFNLMISIDNSRLLTRSLSRHSTPSNILLSEMLLTIYKGIGAAILLTNSPVSESKTLRYYTYVNMLDEYLTDNYEGERYKES